MIQDSNVPQDQQRKMMSSNRHLFRPKLIQTSLCTLILASAFGPIPTASAASVTANITSIKANADSVHLEFSVPLADSDVLFKTGFESGEPQLNLNWHGTGNQSYVTTDQSHGTVLQLTDTINTQKGNYYDNVGGATSSVDSMAQYGIPSIKAASKLTMQYDLKITGDNANILPFFGSLWKMKGDALVDNSGYVVKFAQSTAFSSSSAPTKFYVTTDNGVVNIQDGVLVTLISSKDANYGWGYMYYRFNKSDNSMNLLTNYMTQPTSVTIGGSGISSSRAGETFAAGDTVLSLSNFGDIWAGAKTFNKTTDWITYNNSFDLPTTGYDPDKYGAQFYTRWATNGQLQLDNIKIGYAEKAIIYRDGTQVYAGYDSNYTDTGATDHVSPDPVSDESLHYTYSQDTRQVIASWAPATDRGTYYHYQIQGQLRDGTVGQVQPAQTALVTSGIKGYIVTTDDSSTTKIVSGDIATMSTSYTFTPTEDKRYIHIAPVDNNGNIGETKTMTLADNDLPVLTLTPSTQTPTKSDVLVSITATDDTTWITHTTLPNGENVASGNTSFIAKENGTYTVTARDFLGNTTSQSITISNIDKDSPVITFTPDGSDWQPDKLNVNVLTNDRILKTVAYIVNQEATRPDHNAAWIDGSENFSITLPAENEGGWYVHVVALDSAGNESYSRSQAFRIKALPSKLSDSDISLRSYSTDSITGILATHLDAYYEVKNTTTGTTTIIPAGRSTFVDTHLASGTLYEYIITPINASGRGQSTIVHYLTLPAAATFDGAYPHSETSVEVKLKPVQSADHYLYILTDKNGNTVSNGIMGTSHVFDGLLPNNKYTLITEAVNSSGQSLESRYTFLTLPSLSHLSVVAVGVDYAKLSWDTVTGDVYYDVKRNDQHIVTVTGETYSTVTNTTYNQYDIAYRNASVWLGDYNLTSGTEYNYAIAVSNASGQSNFKNISLWTLPAAPEIYKRNTTTETAAYAWNHVRGAKGYDVYIDGGKIAQTDQTNYEFTGLKPGSVHSIAIVPFNDFGTGQAAQTSFISLSDSVSSIQLKHINPTSATVYFAPVEGADSYLALVNGVEFTSKTPEIDLTGLTAGESYTVQVHALNESGKSAQHTIQFQTLPLAPTSASVTSNTNHDFNLSFTAAFGAQSYRIYNPYGQLMTTTKQLQVTLPSPGAGIPSSFGIAAVGKDGESVDRLWIDFQGAATPAEADPLHIQNLTNDSATITWKPFNGAVSYNLYNGDEFVKNVQDEYVTVDQLASSTTYDNLGIRAVNATGVLSDMYKVKFETHPYSDFHVHVQDITTSTATINITDGRETDLYIFANEQGEIQRSPLQTVNLEHLSDAHRYTIQVWSENASGVRSSVHSIHFKTKEKNLGNVPSTALHPFTEENDKGSNEDHSNIHAQPVISAEDTPTKLIRFTDVESRYSEYAIHFLADRGIVNGDATGKFNPKDGITRAEFVSMLLRAKNEQNEESATSLSSSSAMFTDIEGKWYTHNVEKAATMNYIDGYPDGSFKPDRVITRAEAAKILQNFIDQEKSTLYSFTDERSIPSWAKPAIDQLGGELFIGYENGQFKPQRNITKEETAVVIYRLLNK
ncbi:S-layer homology domain-containing protein [Paenibacillus kandeliae]|uniref:S-layer homology domain-containing protein n=1 Tax=Paenibacillus kandeliae TaxID=3231269 RepID=UPI00345A5025